MRTYGKNLQDFVKTLRADKNLTLEQLGKKLGVTKQYVFAVESGQYPSVPLKFTLKLLGICEKPRKEWLEDLLLESYQDWVVSRAGGNK